MVDAVQTMLREVVAVFPDERSLDAAIDDLEEHGFDRAEISLMASEQAVTQKLGDRYRRIEDAADDPSTPRQVPIMPEDRGAGTGSLIGGLAYVGALAAIGTVVASGGAVLAAVAAAVAGGASGGALGGIFAKWLGDRHAREVADQLRRGGLLLWVNIRTPECEAKAIELLQRHTGVPVRAHDIAAVDPDEGPGPSEEPYDIGVPTLFRLRS